MILVNLLPHREEARKRRRDTFNVMAAVAALVGGLIGGGIFLWYQGQISEQQSVNRTLQSEIKKLEEQIKDVAKLQEEIAALRARQQAVEDLQSDRNLPVHLLNELVRLLPDGTYVTGMKQENQTVALDGSAQSNDRVSELLHNLGNKTPWMRKPELVEIVAGTVALSAREQRRVANFKMKVGLARSSEVKPVASAPAAVKPALAVDSSAPALAPNLTSGNASPSVARVVTSVRVGRRRH